MKAVNHVSMLPSFIMVVNGKEKHFTQGSVDGYGLGGGTTCTGYYMRKLFDPGN